MPSGRSGTSPSRRGCALRSRSIRRCRRRSSSDEQRLRQVLRNLLSNAFKFTDQGGVTLSMVAARRARSRFTVSDTGVGHPRGQAEADLRGVPAGRRDDLAQVRRNRARPVDLPGARAPARRRASGGVRARRRQPLLAAAAAAGERSPNRRSRTPTATGQPARHRRGDAPRPDGARDRRRRPHRVRAHRDARALRDEGRIRRERPGGDRATAASTRTPTSCCSTS